MTAPRAYLPTLAVVGVGFRGNLEMRTDSVPLPFPFEDWTEVLCHPNRKETYTASSVTFVATVPGCFEEDSMAEKSASGARTAWLASQELSF